MTNSPLGPKSKPGRRPPDLSMDQEPDGFERLERAGGTHADFVPIFPLGFYIWGLFPDGAEGSGLAVFTWLLVALFWTPWVLLRVAMRTPRGDPHAALAILGVGLWPWLIFLLAVEWASTRTGLIVTFPVIFLFGASSLLAAHFEWPRTKTPAGRSALLCLGAVVYGVYAALFLGGLALGVAEGAGILTVGIGAVGGAAVFAAVVLIREAVRSSTSAWP